MNEKVPPNSLPGDANLDGTVSFADYQILEANFGKPGDWRHGDFNADGKVNSADQQILEGNYGKASLGKDCTDWGHTAIAGKSPSVATQRMFNATRTAWNKNCFAAGIDLTCVPLSPKCQGGTLIARNKVLLVKHWLPSVGTVFTYLTASNVPKRARLTSLAAAVDDLAVGTVSWLDDPAGITPALILPESIAPHLPPAPVVTYAPLLLVNQDRQLSIIEISLQATSWREHGMLNHVYRVDPAFIPWNAPVVRMYDSGQPRFVVLGGKPVLIMPATTSSGGYCATPSALSLAATANLEVYAKYKA